MSIEIRLENFSGPLDLLLHLIKSNEMDIYDIRIVEITEQYLNIIEQMKRLDLDIAGEFLLMAATLVHIKSRMLLPVSDDIADEEGEDPREELIKRLLEYQRYKEVSELFQKIPRLDRDVFTGYSSISEQFSAEALEDDSIVAGVYQLADAFHRLLKNKPVEIFHEVVRETLSVADYIDNIIASLSQCKRKRLTEFFSDESSRGELIVTFLAMLELVRMRMVNVEQVEPFSDVWLSLAVTGHELVNTLSNETVPDYE